MRLLILSLIVLALPLHAFAAPSLPGKVAQPAAGNVVTEADVRRAVEEFVAQRSSGLPAEVTVKRVSYGGGEMALPPGAVSYDVMAPQSWEGWGNVSLALVVRVNDQVKRNLTVRVEVEALADMVLAARPLERGEVIREGDVSLGKRDLAKVSGRLCRSVADVVGKRVKMSVRGNTPLRDDYLELVPLVKSGQLVTVLAESETVKVSTSGRAKGSGALGDTVMVQNLSSMKEIPARVVSESTVKVEFQ